MSKFLEGIDYSFGMHIPPEPIAFTFLKILIYPCLMYFLEKSLQQIRIKVKIHNQTSIELLLYVGLNISLLAN